MTGRPVFYCAACGGTVTAARRIADVETVEAIHRTSCPGAELAPADIVRLERARHGEAAAARYSTAIAAARLADRMPQTGDPEGECLCDVTDDGYWQLSIICPVHVTAVDVQEYL